MVVCVDIDLQVNGAGSYGVTYGGRAWGRAAAKVLDVAGFSVEIPQVCFKKYFSY